jgi:hypothetical protein
MAFDWALYWNFASVSVSNLSSEANPMFLHFGHQGRPWHAETSRSAEWATHNPVRRLQGFQDVMSLGFP